MFKLLRRLLSRLMSPETETQGVSESTKTLTPDGLRLTEFPSSFTKYLRLYGLSGTYAQLYASQPNIRTAVDGIARECAELNLKMYERLPHPPGQPSDRIEVDDHGMIELLREPVPGESVYRFWYDLFADIEIYDLALLLKIRTAAGRPPGALLRVPPANLLPYRNPITGRVDYWVGARGERVDPSELVVFWGFDPSLNHGSLPAMETLRRILADDQAAGDDREGRWKNSLRKDGVIEPDLLAKDMSDEARESYMVDLEDSLTGSAGTGRPALLLPGHHWKDSTWSPREMEYLNARKLSRTEVAAAFHVPPAFIAAAANNSEPGQGTLDYVYQSSIPPRLTRVERELEAQLLPEFDLVRALRQRRYVKFNLDAKLRGSFEKAAAIMATTAGGPVITVNEGRARLDLPSKGPEFDELYSPLNSRLGGGPQASPQNPTDTPAGGLNPAGTTPGGPVAPSRGALMKEDIERLVTKHLSRQRNTHVGGKPLKRERWDKELTDDLFKAGVGDRATCEDRAKAINDRTDEMLAEGVSADTVFGDDRVRTTAKEVTG